VNPLEAPRRISFDLDTIAGVVRKKWWIVPFTMLIGFVLMFWQESDLQTEPRYFSLTRVFEPEDESRSLLVVGLDPNIYKQGADLASHLFALSSNSIEKNIREQLPDNVSISFNTTQPVDAPVLKFASQYSINCQEQTNTSCVKALELYEIQLEEIRRRSFTEDLKRSEQLLQNLIESVQSNNSDVLLEYKLNLFALSEFSKSISGNVNQVAEYSESGGPQVTNVSRKSLGFGLLSGFFIGFLILLQIIASDDKIRSSRKLVQLVGEKKFLAEVSKTGDTRELSIALLGAFDKQQGSTLAFLPVDPQVTFNYSLNELENIFGINVLVLKPFSELALTDFEQFNELQIVCVVTKHVSRISNLNQCLSSLTKTSKHPIGIVLVS
jgi:hypothetical protein